MNKIKIVVISFLVLALTGCTVEYNIEILEDTTIKEDFSTIDHKSAYAHSQILEPNVVINNAIEKEMDRLDEIGYNYKQDFYDDYVTVSFNNTYQDFNEYIDKAKDTYTQWFETVNVSTIGTVVQFQATDFYQFVEWDPNKYIVNELNINMIIPFEVTKHNADETKIVDNKVVYTWNINEETEAKEINITYDTSKKAKTSWTFEIVIGILILTIIIITIVYNKIIKIENVNKI